MNNKIMYAGIFAVAAILGYRYTQKAETFDAHVSPFQEETQVARNWGTIERVATERNIMAGQAVGQTINYNSWANTASNGLSQVMDLSVYAATMRSTDPVWAQNYPGRAVGQE